MPEIKLRDDIVLSLGASYRDRHTGSFYDYGFGSYYDSKSELQTYAFTPKMEVTTPIGGLKNVFVVGSDYDRYPTTVSSSGAAAGSVPVDERHQQEGLRLLCGREDIPLGGPCSGGRLQETEVELRRRLQGLRQPGLERDTGTYSYDRDAYRLSANYSILKKANVFASYSEGFRFPTTDEFVVYGYSPAPGVYVPTSSTPSSSPRPPREFDIGVRWDPVARGRGQHHLFSKPEQGRDLLQPS